LAPEEVAVADFQAPDLMEAIQYLAQLLLLVADVAATMLQIALALEALVVGVVRADPVVLVIPQARHHHKVIMVEQVLIIVLLAEVVQVLLDQIQLPMPDQTVVLVQRHQLLALR
jgi:hypothetical protein